MAALPWAKGKWKEARVTQDSVRLVRGYDCQRLLNRGGAGLEGTKDYYWWGFFGRDCQPGHYCWRLLNFSARAWNCEERSCR